MDSLLQDLRSAARSLRKSPGFTTVATLALALAIGANTAVFTVLNALSLRSLPVREPHELVEMLFKYPGDPRMNNFPWRYYEHFRDQNHVFSDVIAMSPGRFQLTDAASGPEAVYGVYVSGNFFDALGLRPTVGRLLGPGDTGDGATVAILTFSYWKSRFNLDRSVVGTSLNVNDVPVTIVGVLPPDFHGLLPGMNPSVWVPVAVEPLMQKPSRLANGSLNVAVVARLKPRVTLAQAEAEVRVIDRTRLADSEARSHDVQWRQATIVLERAGTGLSILRDRFANSVALMMYAGGVLLLIACINVASMLLARGAAQRRDVVVRVALGASRTRIVRQILTESLLLSTVAGLLGLWFAYVGAHALVNLIASGRPPIGMPQRLEIPVPLDLTVLLFTAAAAVVTGLVFGLVPAWHAFASHVSSPLREIGTVGDTKRFKRFSNGLIVAQVALSVILLAVAALFQRHLADLRTVGLGFQTKSVLQASLDWSRTRFTSEQIATLNRQLLDRARSIAGVRSATLAGMTPISGAAGSQFISVSGFQEDPNSRRRVSLNIVTPGYFDTLGTRFIAGRDFSRDDEGHPRVAIVNQAMANYYFGAASPLGRLFSIDGQSRPLEIVGVVADAKYQDLHETPPRTIYMNAFQGGLGTNLLLVLRTDARVTAIAPQVQSVVRDVAPMVPAARVTTLEDQVDASILPERMIAALSALFGAAAAVLVTIGLYGLLAFTVARRTKEIGIRIAIGATNRDVIRMVVSSALGLVTAGVCVGVPIAMWTKGAAGRVLAIVAATQAERPVTLPTGEAVPIAVAAAALVLVALVASYLPARRAARVDPMVALRTE